MYLQLRSLLPMPIDDVSIVTCIECFNASYLSFLRPLAHGEPCAPDWTSSRLDSTRLDSLSHYKILFIELIINLHETHTHTTSVINRCGICISKMTWDINSINILKLHAHSVVHSFLSVGIKRSLYLYHLHSVVNGTDRTLAAIRTTIQKKKNKINLIARIK